LPSEQQFVALEYPFTELTKQCPHGWISDGNSWMRVQSLVAQKCNAACITSDNIQTS